jgi:glucokinase
MSTAPVVLGIDIGGTTTTFGFVAPDGNCLAETELPTRASEPLSLFMERLTERIRDAFAPISVGHDLKGIGIGAPNADYRTGMLVNPPNLKWGSNVDLAGLFRLAFDLPVAVTNDANAAALGEMAYGAARGMEHFMVVTLGTGVGSGIVVNGEVLYGADGFAGELGHTVVDPDGRLCGCGNRGCLETYASAGGLCRTFISLLANHDGDSSLLAIPFSGLSARLVYEAARQGDRLACAAFEETGRILGIKLADAAALLSPEAIFLHGGLAAAGNLIFDPVRRSLEQHLPGMSRERVKLLPSGLGDRSAAVLGAAALVQRLLEKEQPPGFAAPPTR